MKKYISEELTKEKIKGFTNEYIYLIGGECGSGKTTAIMTNLYEYAALKDKQILYLCNRSTLEEQLIDEHLEEVKGHMEIAMYQSVTTSIEKNYSLPFHRMEYDFLVVDEAHLIFDSSDFDINPVLFVEYLNHFKGIILVLTGTPKGFKKLEPFLNRKIKTVREVNKMNHCVRNIYVTGNEIEFDEFKRNCIRNGDKNFELTDKVKNFKDYKENNIGNSVANIASIHRQDYNQIMSAYDKAVRKAIVGTQKMICEALIATSSMEVGINIIAEENYLVSYNYLPTESTIIQFASRIRVKNQDEFYVDLIFLMKKTDKKIINKMKERLKKMKRNYKVYGDYEQICKRHNHCIGERDSLDGIIAMRECNPITMKCLEEKIAFQEKFYESEQLLNSYTKLLNELYPNVPIICLEKMKIEKELDVLVKDSKSFTLITREEKMEFRLKMKESGIKTRIKDGIPSINLINDFFEQYNINYRIKQQRKRFDGNKDQTRYWAVEHVNY